MVFLPTCHSTNDIASSLLKEAAVPEGTLVVTDYQTAGKGQRGNHWEADAGKNLIFSLILKPGFVRASEQFGLSMAISLGIHEFLADYFPEEDIKIKWPNDHYHKGRKIAGVLVENTLNKQTIESSIVGIGVNVNQMQFVEKKAVSMRMAMEEQSTEFNLPMLLAELAQHLESNYLRLRTKGSEPLKERYLLHLHGHQQERTFSQRGRLFRGRIVGVDAIGRLRVEEGPAVHSFGLKEIEFL